MQQNAEKYNRLISEKESQINALVKALRASVKQSENLKNKSLFDWWCGNSSVNRDIDPEDLEMLNDITSSVGAEQGQSVAELEEQQIAKAQKERVDAEQDQFERKN